jgi:hypothetical protein
MDMFLSCTDKQFRQRHPRKRNVYIRYPHYHAQSHNYFPVFSIKGKEIQGCFLLKASRVFMIEMAQFALSGQDSSEHFRYLGVKSVIMLYQLD